MGKSLKLYSVAGFLICEWMQEISNRPLAWRHPARKQTGSTWQTEDIRLHRTGLPFGCRFALFAPGTSGSTITRRFRERCAHHHGVPLNTDSKGSVAGSFLEGRHGSHHAIRPSEALGLEEHAMTFKMRSSGYKEPMWIARIRISALGWSNCLTSATNTWCSLPTARNTNPQTVGKGRSGFSHYYI